MPLKDKVSADFIAATKAGKRKARILSMLLAQKKFRDRKAFQGRQNRKKEKAWKK